jgi:hypothetical protein
MPSEAERGASRRRPGLGVALARRRRAAAAGLAVLIALLLSARALGDADPASDVLLGENVFYPYSPAVSSTLQATLNGATAAAHRAHFAIKVALIATPVDLGAIPTFFGKPRQYAAFLDQEISFGAAKVPLLVVMPDGYGTAGVGAGVSSAAAALPKPTARTSDALARAAAAAVRTLAAAAGHGISGAPGSSTPGSGAGAGAVLAILIAVCVALAGGTITVRRRQSRRPADRR